MTCEEDEDGLGQFASPPCFMHELDPSYVGMPVDPQQARDVACWRKSERERLIAARLALSADERLVHAARIARDLDAFLAIAPRSTVSVYWPVRGEPDLKPWMTALCKPFTKAKVRYFDQTEVDKAWTWLREDVQPMASA